MTARGVDSHPVYGPTALAERRAKARTVRSIRAQLDHALMLQSLGMPVDAQAVNRLCDQLAALARTAPFLTLAEVV